MWQTASDAGKGAGGGAGLPFVTEQPGDVTACIWRMACGIELCTAFAANWNLCDSGCEVCSRAKVRPSSTLDDENIYFTVLGRGFAIDLGLAGYHQGVPSGNRVHYRFVVQLANPTSDL